MCGIVGFWQRDGAAIDLEVLHRATQRIRHRGPDDEGYLLVNTAMRRTIACTGAHTHRYVALPPMRDFYQENFDLVLGFRRLAILDLSAAGHQPMASPDQRQWIVYNGEIYNFIELRQELVGLGYHFVSDSDTEVILAAYRQWGSACLERFNGMWSFAIWDQATRSLFVARDRFGIKPFYYYTKSNLFAFASEPKALVGLSQIPFQPNEKMIYQYVLGGILPDPRTGETFFQGIKALPAAHTLTVSPNDLACQRYWTLHIESEATVHPNSIESIAAFRDLLTDSIRLRLRADVPVGTCLSGGLDSSSIVTLVSQLLESADQADVDTQRWYDRTQQRTFSAVYNTVGRYNERPYIETVLQGKTNVTGYFAHPSAEQLGSQLEQLVWHQDEPFLSTSIFAQWCVMAEANRQGVRILLDGQGADELLAGYRPYNIYLASQLRSGKFNHFQHELRAISAVTGISTTALLRQILQTAIPESWFVSLRNLKWRLRSADAVFTPDFRTKWAAHALGSHEVQQQTNLSQHLFYQLTATLPDLLRYEDRNSMAHSIEARIPFLDYRLVEYVFQQGAPWRLHNGWTKWLLRKAMTDVLPHEIAWRRDKVGFETPQQEWLPILLELGKDLFDSQAHSAEFLDLQVVRRHLCAGEGKDQPNQSLTWRLLNLEMWLRIWHRTAGADLHRSVLQVGS
ncbi:MAG: asparagine synthase (glutamine-hydrolyzing) [Caldilineaceae bacterium]